AMLFGVSKIVVKAHGNSDAETFGNAIGLAYNMVQAQVIEKVVKELPQVEE
ncbi:MAG: hypothetical protein K2O05_04610, partial [Anaeroplasmataceae bacterium]|nr:hypothetical protein [Anaeroplasmataceae bacterium]